ncbi:MAG: ATP-binding cassette domain-containing protein [Myxococcota bacterium]
MGDPLLEFHRVTFGDVLTEVSLTVHAQEIVGVVFQHGIGKSVLLQLGAGLIEPSAGEVVYRGRRIRDRPDEPTIGFVFEDDGGLFENMTLYDNIALPLRFHTRSSESEIEAKVREILSVVGMDDEAERFPWTMTRDRQRLASLARALVYEPDVCFIDDFFIGADADAFHRMEETVSLAREAYGTAFLLVLEAAPEDFGIADRLCLIDHGAVLELDRMSLS